MANRNTKAKRAILAKARAQERKASGGDKKFVNPPRQSRPKDLSRLKQLPGYRKPAREAAAPVVKVYKSELETV